MNVGSLRNLLAEFPNTMEVRVIDESIGGTVALSSVERRRVEVYRVHRGMVEKETAVLVASRGEEVEP